MPSQCRRFSLVVCLVFLYGMAVHAQGGAELDSLLAEGKEQFRRGDALRMQWGSDTAEMNGAFRRSIAALERAVALDDGSQEAHYFLGYAYDRLSMPSASFGGLRRTSLEATVRVSREMEKVIAISRRYEGEILILDPYTKISAAWGSLALAYAVAGKLDSARWAFEQGRKAGGFPDGTLVVCRNVLRSCSHDAILITSGANDTFPVWYLQLVERYRTDVTVMSLPLASDPEYVKFMRARYPFGANAIPLTMSDRRIERLRSRYLRKPEHVVIPVPAKLLNELDPSDRRAVGRSVTLAVHGRNDQEWRRVMMVEDDILIAVLRSNHWSRPVYFYGMIDPPVIGAVGLNGYLRQEGGARRIMPYMMDPNTNTAEAFTDSLLLSETNGFEWMPGDAHVDDDGSHQCQNLMFTLLLGEALYHIASLHDTVTAERLLERMEKMMPATRFGYVYTDEAMEVLEFLYLSISRLQGFKAIIEELNAKQSLLHPDGPSGGAGTIQWAPSNDQRS